MRRGGGGSWSAMNWLLLAAAVQLLLFVTFVGFYFGSEQHRQGEVAPHHDLLDVEDVRTHRGGGLEDGLGDARPVGTAQRHQERA